ncbi:autotransporter outer membrane beta-barrel domain-containing protein [Noviherbaspirillum cavernae]|nr:autotransporter outer membrane beta-barrel domain-containing protein [Noviherbaspirillum cavernae]
MAVGAMAFMSGTASAAGCSNTGPNVINGSMPTTCVLGSGSSLDVPVPGGLIDGGEGAGVLVQPLSSIPAVSFITNSGTITGSTGIQINANGVVGTITNNATGIIRGSSFAINNLGTVTSSILNHGLIDGAVALNGAELQLHGGSARVTGPVTGNAQSEVFVAVGANFSTENTFNVGTVIVNHDAKLNMAHDITAANAFVNAGTVSVAAGNTVTVNGNYSHAPDGVFETGLSGASTYGKLVVTGSANLVASSKINVNVVGAPALVAGTSVQPGVITAGTLLTEPAIAVTDNSALFDFIATRNGNAIDLCVAAAGSATCVASNPGPGQTPSTTVVSSVTGAQNTPGLGAARVFDSLIAQGTGAPAAMVPVITALGTLPTEQAVSDAVSQTLPLMTAGMAQVNSSSMQSTNRVIQARQEANKGLSSGDEFIGDRQMWFKPVGSWARQDDRNNVSGYKADTYGMVFGVDHVVSNQVRVGGAFSYMNSKVDDNSGLQNAKVDGYRLIGYGSYSLDARTDLSFQADVGTNRNKGTRTISFGGLNEVAHSNYSSWNAHVGAGVGRTLDVGAKTAFTPSARIDYTYMRDGAYTETGANALNLDVAKNSSKELLLSVDGKLSHALSSTTTLSANLGTAYDALSNGSAITAAYVGGGGQFTTRGLDLPRWLVRGGLGMTVMGGKAMEITARYDVEARESFANHTASVKLRMPF